MPAKRVPESAREGRPVGHGAYSERQSGRVARNYRRRILRQLGLSPKDLDPMGRAFLDQYCRIMAKVVLIDAHLAEHGVLRGSGDPQPALQLYVSLMNSARLALARLEAHILTVPRDPSQVLNDYIREDRDD